MNTTEISFSKYFWITVSIYQQECIPVGCVPPAAEAVCWGGCLPQCMLGYTPGCGPGDPPLQARSLNFPPECGLGDPPPGQTPQLPPWVWAWKPARHAGIPPSWRPARHAGIPPPHWTEFLTHASENIILPQLRCER